MILNSYAILTAFVGLLRLLLGLTVTSLGWSASRALARAATAEDRAAVEGQSYLLVLCTLLLVGLNAASWPLLYLLLQSYVPEWSGVMCIYGVLQVGKDSLGPGRWLPVLLQVLQAAKPVLVFVSGAWFVLYLLNRRTHTGPLLARLFALLIPLGLLAATEAATELTYLAIPKKAEAPPGGCCTVLAAPSWSSGAAAVPPEWATGAFVGGNAILLAGLTLCTGSRRTGPLALGLVLAWGLVALVASGLYLTDVAAPALLQLPHHRCPYDLLPRVPEAVAAVGLYLAGAFCLGWAGVARWAGAGPETAAWLPATVRQLLRLGLWCYLVALTMLAMELALVHGG
jgi:hypothetical protein